MAMDTAVYDELKAKLADSKITVQIGDEKKSLFDYIVYTEEGVEKVKGANKDLTAQRETWESKEKEYKKNMAEIATIKEQLESQLKEKEGTTKKKSQEQEELQRMINAQNEKIDQLNKSHEESQKKIADAEERAKQANAKASEEGLRKDLVTELADHKIVGTQADFAVQVIMAKGYAKLIPDSESGLYKRSICTNKDGKELAADLKTLCKWFAESNTFLVSASGKAGTGMNHDSQRPVGNQGGNRNYLAMIQSKK